jgi:hypothetical protein
MDIQLVRSRRSGPRALRRRRLALGRGALRLRPASGPRPRRPRLVTLAVALGLVAGVLVVVAPSASASPAWSVAPSPTPSGSTHGEISSVSCLSTTSCFAVGTYEHNGLFAKGLLAHWNGSHWSSTTSPNPAGVVAPVDYVNGVACPSPTSCFAVGRYDTPASSGILVAHWNGSHWSSMTSPKPSGSSTPALTAVSCPSTTSCFAVGSYGVPTIGFVKTLVEHWNGSHWSIVPSPNPTGSSGTFLSGVSCPSTTSCFAVGSDTVPRTAAIGALVEHWDGNTWSIMTSANLTGSTQSYLFGVSCPSPNSCFAVGSYSVSRTEKSLLERWNGSAWGVMNSPNRAGYVALHGVSCPNTMNCYAVGYYENNNGPFPKGLVEHWVHGSPWSIMTSSNPSTDTELDGVSCPTTTRCFAVGHYSTASATFSLVERNK